MKVILDLPDWVDGRHIYVFAGIELAAYKHHGQGWKVKTGRCRMCGGCCMGLGEVTDPFTAIEGRCIHLISDEKMLVCSLGSSRPFACSVAIRPKNRKGCTETYDPVL